MNTSMLKRGWMALVFAAVTVSAFAKDDVVVKTYRNTDYAIVSAVFGESDNYRVAIKDDLGNLIYRSAKISNSNMFQRLVDLSSLVDGVYHVYVVNDGSRRVSSFEVSNGRLVEEKMNDAKTDAAFLLRDNEMLYVRHINPAKSYSVMEITNERGEMVYTNELPAREVYNGLYKVSNLPKGNYTVSVATGNRSHRYEFSK